MTYISFQLERLGLSEKFWHDNFNFLILKQNLLIVQWQVLARKICNKKVWFTAFS